jgi:hypothetical protein
MHSTSTVSELIARREALRADANNLRAELSRHCAAVKPAVMGLEIAARAVRVANSLRRLRDR